MSMPRTALLCALVLLAGCNGPAEGPGRLEVTVEEGPTSAGTQHSVLFRLENVGGEDVTILASTFYAIYADGAELHGDPVTGDCDRTTLGGGESASCELLAPKRGAHDLTAFGGVAQGSGPFGATL